MRVSAYREVRQSAGPCVLLESTTSPGPLARLTLLARDPRAVLVADRTGTRVLAGGKQYDLRDPISALRGPRAEAPAGRWPGRGGVAGPLAFDFARAHGPAGPPPLLIALAVDRFVVEEATAGPSSSPSPAPG